MSSQAKSFWSPKARAALFCGCAYLGMFPAVAHAQTVPDGSSAPATASSDATDKPDDAPQPTQSSEIVVTGTNIRGVAPVGTNLVQMNREQVLRTGQSNANDVLAQIPQISSYFNTQVTPAYGVGSPTNVPSIRNLPSAGGSPTLTLLNGYRTVGEGVLQTIFDPANIPPGVIERIDVVPDGGSSIYGSDAVGGVINFITRKRFNGVEAAGHYGFGDDYRTRDVNITAGKDWGSGSALISYAYSWHDAVLGKDRDYITADNTARGGQDFRVMTCDPGNVVANGVNYTLPSFTPGTNLCQPAGDASFYPREIKHNVFASLTQKFADNITFNVNGYWSYRKVTTLGQGVTNPGVFASGTITDANPYFHSIAGETSQQVFFSLAPVYGKTTRNPDTFTSMGITPELDVDLGKDWQLRASLNYGRSISVVKFYGTDGGALTDALVGTSTDTAIDPYDVTKTNPAVIDRIFDFDQNGTSHQNLLDERVVVDGTLFSLPGGNVHLAAGAEHHFEDISVALQTGRIGTMDGYQAGKSSRTVNSFFSEVLIPVFGSGNAIPGFKRLDLSASVRYDGYSDAGNTVNPKIGITWEPVGGIKIRGNYGTSFHAPSLSDDGNTPDSSIQVLPVSPWIYPGDSSSNSSRSTIIVAGGTPGLKPETAKTFSVGADVTPSFVPGLKLSATFWNINYSNTIGISIWAPDFFTNPTFNQYYVVNPTLAQAQAFIPSGLPIVGAGSIASLYTATASPYMLLDLRRKNLGVLKTNGLDFDVSYNRPTGFGSINAEVAGSWVLKRKAANGPTSPITDELASTSRLSMTAILGATIGNFDIQGRLLHSSGYAVANAPYQTHIASYDVINLYAGYKLPQSFLNGKTQLTINVDNLFDVRPPWANSATGVTSPMLGRVVTFGLRTAF